MYKFIKSLSGYIYHSPYLYSRIDEFRRAGIFSSVITLLCILAFKDFVLANIDMLGYKIAYTIWIASIPFLVSLFAPKLFYKYLLLIHTKYNVLWEFLFIFFLAFVCYVIFLLGAVLLDIIFYGEKYYSHFGVDTIIQQLQFLFFLFIVCYTFIRMVDYFYLYREASVKFEKDGDLDTKFTIQSSQKNSQVLTLSNKNILFFETFGNHITVFYLHKGKISKFSIRKTLKEIEEELLLHGYDDTFFKVHKSFIVNVSNVLS